MVYEASDGTKHVTCKRCTVAADLTPRWIELPASFKVDDIPSFMVMARMGYYRHLVNAGRRWKVDEPAEGPEVELAVGCESGCRMRKQWVKGKSLLELYCKACKAGPALIDLSEDAYAIYLKVKEYAKRWRESAEEACALGESD